jgi:hypothetical protein
MAISASDVVLDRLRIRGCRVAWGAWPRIMRHAVETPLRLGDIGWLTQQHAELYAADEGSTRRSSRWSRASSPISWTGHDPACERGWIARAGDGGLARSSA